MRLSLDIVCEELCRRVNDMSETPLSCEVIRSIQAREVERVLPAALVNAEELAESTLWVVSNDEALTFVGRYEPDRLLVVAAPGAEVGLLGDVSALDIVELGVARTSLTAGEVTTLALAAWADLASWDERMLRAVMLGEGLQTILDIGCERLVNPIALFDRTSSLIAWDGELGDAADGTIWREVLGVGYVPIEHYEEDERRAINEHRSPGEWPWTHRFRRDSAHESLSAVLFEGDEEYAYLGAVDLNGPFTAGQLGLVDLVRSRLQYDGEISHGNLFNRDRSDYLVVQLLEGANVSDRLMDRHLALRGWDEVRRFRLLLCEGVASVGIGLGSLLSRVRRGMPRAVVVSEGDDVVALFASDDYPPQSPAFEMTVVPLMRELGVRCAMSEPFADIRTCSAMLAQCRAILEWGPAVEPGVMAQMGSAFEGLLVQTVTQDLEPEVLCDTRVLDLARRGYRGDVERGREMVHELYVYLVCGRNAHQAARQLYMHRNTLNYRMERLEEILALSLATIDPWRVVQLELSCLVALEGA